MFKGMANLASLMRQAQTIGPKLAEANEKLAHLTATGSAGGGMVEATANGLGELVQIQIEPELLSGDQPDLLQTMIVSAVNQAIAAGRELQAEALQSVTGEMNMPGLDEAMAKLREGLGPDQGSDDDTQ